ncbi:MAG: hypothetical protein V9G09_03465 [Candidatus Nanopelagicales bacterium]
MEVGGRESAERPRLRRHQLGHLQRSFDQSILLDQESQQRHLSPRGRTDDIGEVLRVFEAERGHVDQQEILPVGALSQSTGSIESAHRQRETADVRQRVGLWDDCPVGHPHEHLILARFGEQPVPGILGKHLRHDEPAR